MVLDSPLTPVAAWRWPSEKQSSEILRFGTFEADLRARELCKQGRRIKLQEPFRVLAVLLQRPGKVVTREELRNQNWSPDTFVRDQQAARSSGDSADNPPFIETLPRRGYRFLAPVTNRDQREPAATAPEAAEPTKRRKVVLAVAVVLATATAAGWFCALAIRLCSPRKTLLCSETLSTVEKYNTPLEQATASSLEALQAYSLGFKADGAGDDPQRWRYFGERHKLTRICHGVPGNRIRASQ
ncbi:MAG: hypothetical protein DMG38_09790 [Acidobacteria bacterium]|nr:MAG: hypothetical protein DMG38_09790 [Acidobacteriota bacterium]